jgi:hypothetical protein
MPQKIEQQPLEPATSEGFSEAEYEEAVASLEPEHPDRQILDRFFDKLAEGDLSAAAKELWALHAAGGSLCRSDVELVADLLDGSAAGTVFPYQLGFAKRGRGRPRHALQGHLQAPWNAFATGDELKTSEELRKLDALGGTDLETLAGLLSDDLALHAHFPWRLVLQNRDRESRRLGAQKYVSSRRY